MPTQAAVPEVHANSTPKPTKWSSLAPLPVLVSIQDGVRGETSVPLIAATHAWNWSSTSCMCLSLPREYPSRFPCAFALKLHHSEKKSIGVVTTTMQKKSIGVVTTPMQKKALASSHDANAFFPKKKSIGVVGRRRNLEKKKSPAKMPWASGYRARTAVCARTFSGLSASEPPVMPPPAPWLSHFASCLPDLPQTTP